MTDCKRIQSVLVISVLGKSFEYQNHTTDSNGALYKKSYFGVKLYENSRIIKGNPKESKFLVKNVSAKNQKREMRAHL